MYPVSLDIFFYKLEEVKIIFIPKMNLSNYTIDKQNLKCLNLTVIHASVL